MTPLPTRTRSALLASVAALVPLGVLAGPAQADSTVNPHKLAVLGKPVPHRSHVSAKDESQRVSGFNHNKHLHSVHTVVHQPQGGKPGVFRAEATSYVKVPFFEVSATYVDNDANVAWLGSDPFNADKIKLTQSWSTHGLKVSFNGSMGMAGPSAGVSISGAGGNANEVRSLKKNWRISSAVDSVRFSGMDVTKVRHGAAGTFNFKHQWFTVSTTDAALV